MCELCDLKKVEKEISFGSKGREKLKQAEVMEILWARGEKGLAKMMKKYGPERVYRIKR